MNGQLGFADADATLCDTSAPGPSLTGAIIGLPAGPGEIPEAAFAPQDGPGPVLAATPLAVCTPYSSNMCLSS